MGATITAREADAIFGALADATRRDILARAMDGELGVSELAASYPMSFAAVQKHVAVLERAGLIRKRPSGRRRVVSTDLDGLRRARSVLEHYEALWRERVEGMHRLLAEDGLPAPQDPTSEQEYPR
jgi:DNA-binding transcriptional ArsR family regulator